MNTNSREQQDNFIMWMLAKEGGYYLEIGSATPQVDNNTFLLEKEFGWKGISVEINSGLCSQFSATRSNKIINSDATQVDYLTLLEENGAPATIDYLQIDCDPALNSLKVLQRIPFDRFHFNVITFEHDFYNYPEGDENYLARDLSREILRKRGYLPVGLNICHQNLEIVFEDWWLSPNLDPELLSIFDCKNEGHKISTEFLDKITKKLTSINHNNYKWLKLKEKI